MSSSRQELAPAADGERGTVLLLWSVLLVGLVAMLAIVIDLGHLREARATSQSVADLAALAAGEHLASVTAPDPQEGCNDAVAFVRMNIPDMPATLSVPCGELPPTCGDTTPRAVVHDEGTAGRYRVEITFPVPDSDILDERTASGLRDDDGHPCERMGVRIRRTNDGYFSGVVGADKLSTGAFAVVRRRPPEESRIPNLWLLDPTGCNVLSTQGSATLLVGTDEKSGLITLDSDGSNSHSCGGTAYTIDVGGSGWVEVAPGDNTPEKNPNQLDPPGEISLVAMWPGQTDCTDGNPKACNQSQIGWDNNIVPQPTRRAQRATRAIVDHRYNCRSNSQGAWHSPSAQYPDYPEDRDVPRIPIVNCNDADGQPFIDQLRMAVGPSGRPGGELSSFQRWTDHYGCSNPSGVPGELPGNWWIDCNELSLGSGLVNFTGGNVVFNGTLRMSGGTLRINSGLNAAGNGPAGGGVLERTAPAHCLTTVTGCIGHSSPDAAFVYFRNGNIRFSSNPKFHVTRAAVVQDGGYVRMNGNAPPVWSGPREGPFAGLSLWSELAEDSDYIINGGSGMELEGVFFTPQAVFTINGGGGLKPQKAQFISYRLKLAGSGTLELEPDGLNQLSLPPPVAGLIR